MKLYTEEQVRKAIELTYLVELYGTRDAKFRHTPDEIVEKLTSIELPIDEEIENQVKYISHNYFDIHNTNHYQGLKEGAEKMAKWMKDKIKQKQLLKEVMKADEKDGLYHENK